MIPRFWLKQEYLETGERWVVLGEEQGFQARGCQWAYRLKSMAFFRVINEPSGEMPHPGNSMGETDEV